MLTYCKILNDAQICVKFRKISDKSSTISKLRAGSAAELNIALIHTKFKRTFSRTFARYRFV